VVRASEHWGPCPDCGGGDCGPAHGRRRTQELRESQEALRERKSRLRSITENVSDGIYRSTAADGLVYANQAFIDLFECESPDDLRPPRSALRAPQPPAGAYRAGGPAGSPRRGRAALRGPDELTEDLRHAKGEDSPHDEEVSE
jgi:PAS domain-containing protein